GAVASALCAVEYLFGLIASGGGARRSLAGTWRRKGYILLLFILQ
ncbi:hypothetical protein A2U01_0089349, partial [Trifolium medium]|nr:hypothetical protein [Trifolium medium]